ncbi:MAG: methylated-DNA--[protein]-cysteine S-methyltransferase [Peptoniphilus sp.]|nr:methylated-DNA--[protein]-cysteine S-methyltransferase [Peptoniphilus sp.]MDY3118507.1 methylated-DNA--[protein]-cysteine S-methyltransferase [Peptoniphilus sp.]
MKGTQEEKKLYRKVLATPVGRMEIVATEEEILSVDYTADACGGESNALCRKAAEELEEYFSGKRKTFDLPLKKAASPFADKVYEETKKIPYGKTTSYGALARAMGKPGAARAVGTALSKNPHVILMPCHRVVRQDGSVGKYTGGADKKVALLILEGSRS